MTKDSTIVHFDSPEAAQLVTTSGWRSRDGYFYGDDERTARWAGCTHVNCRDCGAVTEKGHLICDACNEKASLERFIAMPRGPWKGREMLYSQSLDKYYNDPDEAIFDLEQGQKVDDLRLILCTPNMPRLLDVDDFSDELPEDGDYHDLPRELIDAIEAFNTVARACQPLSWSPGEVAWNGNILVETPAAAVTA